ncbi:MAG TPA: hypothetical protein VHX20_02715 [Terracidiphilus sp.]|nr:hypothetical protein [Terracidiphilus sp.]
MKNTARFKPGIDDETMSNCAPTLGALMLAHFSTPMMHNPAWYEDDKSWFASHPGRRLRLRAAFKGEMDVYTSDADWWKRPTLWVCVAEHAPGYHERTPRFRGQLGWIDLKSDMEVAQMLFQMSWKEGEDALQFKSYISNQRIQSKKQRSNSRIN